MPAVRIIQLEQQPFYTVQTLAKRLCLSDRQIRRMVKDRKIGSYVVEGVRRFDQSDVDLYLAKRREEAA